jgi:hypothetical protein
VTRAVCSPLSYRSGCVGGTNDGNGAGPMSEWRCAGMRWDPAAGPALTWVSPSGGERLSALPVPGGPLAFAVTGDRRCVGVRHAQRRIPCPLRAALPAHAVNPLCPDCAAVDRRHSVAADTALDDPRTFRLYLAWFGPGLLKVGITAAERGPRRLLDQGALAHTWLGEGRLPGVRRAEATLGAALGIPDRMSHSRKAAARSLVHPSGRDVQDLSAAHRAAQASGAWPQTVAPLSFAVERHLAAYHLDPERPPCPEVELSRLAPDATVTGTLAAAVGSDAYLATGDAGDAPLLLVDLRLLAGWPLARALPSAATTAATRPVRRTAAADEAQPGLF